MSAVLASGALITAALCYRGGMTPPTSRVDTTYRVESGVGRLVPFEVAVRTALIANYLVYPHMALEVYALWATSEIPLISRLPGLPGVTNICPLKGSSGIPRIYPDGKLPLLTIAPLGLIVLGGLLRINCHRQLGKMFTWDTSIVKDHKLVTSGPYKIVRHPSYTGFTMLVVGYAWFLYAPGTFMRECLIGSNFPPTLTTQSALGVSYTLCWGVFYADATVFVMRRSFAEDRMLKREFGKEWEEWAKQVRWNIIPYVL